MSIELIPSLSLLILSLSGTYTTKIIYLSELIRRKLLIIIYKLIYARLLKIYAKPVLPRSKDLQNATFEAMNYKINRDLSVR